MDEIAIRVENLSKKYRIGVLRHDTLRDQIAHRVISLINRREKRNGNIDTFWALKNASFEIKRGEVVGIIGRNGAGKSTLLKLLSRITEPTTGRIEIYGRTGTLLEVGTGFHPELTGRENIYLNGAILGMSRKEIEGKFDEIIEFAEIQNFLDTPVKRYSSGMYVRLAFSVAAHLETEILFVDEVLSVGDTSFQKKCLGKMGEVSGEGRTVLFVSHNMAAVQSLCNRGIFLKDGVIRLDGAIDDTIGAYLNTLEQMATCDISQRRDRRGRGEIRLIQIDVVSVNGNDLNTLITGCYARFTFKVSRLRPGLACKFTIYNNFGIPISTFKSTELSSVDIIEPELGLNIVCDIDELLLVPGRYWVNVAISVNGELEDHVEAATFFNIESGVLKGRQVKADAKYGSVLLNHKWKLPI